MTFAVSESSTDQYQCGDGGTGVEVMVGSGVNVEVAVAVFVAGIAVGWEVDVALTGWTGADVVAAGLAQADRNMINENNRETILFIIPLF